MPRPLRIARLALTATFTIVLASACGGQSFTGTSGEAGSSSTAGSSQGGSTSHAGTGSAGRAQAGSATGGSGSGSSAGAGAGGGGGGAPDEACGAAPDGGVCNAYLPAWYHDPSTGICRPFAYGGCGGNLNRYTSLAECQKACPARGPNYDACKQPSDCVVTGTGCCGICDGPGITAHDLIAYNKQQYVKALPCGLALDAAPGGSGSEGAEAPVACAPCGLLPFGQGTLKYFVPNCVAGQCVVEDLRTSPVTACKANEDCKVRNGSGCCEGCAGGDPVAVRNDGSFEQLVCDTSTACAGCLPAPSGALPYCGKDGHCQVAFPADVGG